MTYNLRKGKGKGTKTDFLVNRVEDMADAAEFRSILSDIQLKFDKLMEGKVETDKKLSQILQKMSKTEKDVAKLKKKQEELESSTQFLSDEMEKMKECVDVENPGSVSKHMAALEKKIDDLENRSRRNNVIVWNIPQASENSSATCEEFVESFLTNHLKIPEVETIEVERAHRSPTFAKQNQAGTEAKPRPIHARLLRYQDRQLVIRNAKKLKDNPFRGMKVFISDDVSLKVRKEREHLRKNVLEGVRSQPDVDFAYIPYQIPSRIIYKETTGTFKSLFYNPSMEER